LEHCRKDISQVASCIAWYERGGGDLVKQWLELLIVVLVNQRNAQIIGTS
jgi:hypothetical protein